MDHRPPRDWLATYTHRDELIDEIADMLAELGTSIEELTTFEDLGRMPSRRVEYLHTTVLNHFHAALNERVLRRRTNREVEKPLGRFDPHVSSFTGQHIAERSG